ncbi:MAG: DUF2088 domain-containing protein, partial [Caldilineaceae bacterium]|nr:DUF2088 domain-containing protein [Caldilineaceae bacterium]
MKIDLAYGRSGLALDLPDTWNVTVIEPRFVPGQVDEAQALRAALDAPHASPPLRDRVKPTDRVGIVFSDITRATPHGLILPAVLDQLSHVPAENVTLFCALGTHRPNTPEELRAMFATSGSAATAERLMQHRIVQNDAFDPATQVMVGITRRGHEIWLNRDIAACDVKVLTGFIEPHFFAGF